MLSFCMNAMNRRLAKTLPHEAAAGGKDTAFPLRFPWAGCRRVPRYRCLAVWLVLVLMLPVGCVCPPLSSGPPESVDALAVGHCRYLGTITENADPEQLFPWIDGRRCPERVHRRPRSLGATHLVWRFRNRTGAAAEAFRCP